MTFHQTTITQSVKNDLILLFILLISGFVLLFFTDLYNKDPGDYVIVRVNGEALYELKLKENITKEIVTENGTNTIVIEKGEAYVSNADCPDKYCAKHKPVSRSGESIICLPHKLEIKIVNKSKGINIDAVSE